MREKNIDPFPAQFLRTHTSLQSIREFEKSEEESDIKVTVGGRITARRGMGKATFIDLRDAQGQIQLLIRKNNLGEDYDLLNYIDIGDWLGATGILFKTKTGEITFISPTAETATRTFEITIEANNDDLLFKSGITASISIKGSTIKAHKISPSILTLQDDGTVGVKAIDEKNTVVFYPIKKEIDTIDGMWVSGLPNETKIITTGQEYVTVGQIIQSE